MSNILQEILAAKRAEVEQARAKTPLAELERRPAYRRSVRPFYKAVAVRRADGRLNVIAEVKRASPSAGVIAVDFDPVAIARRYEQAGAAALSVLTDRAYFGGELAYIEQIKAAVSLPVLRKDFIVDEYQIHESRAAGADAVLLIAEALPTALVRAFLQTARLLDLTVLVELHELDSLRRVLAVLAKAGTDRVLLGVNNRDLKRQVIDLTTTERLAALVPNSLPIVAESGLKTRADVRRMEAAGVRALLIGETLMRSADPAAALVRLLHEAGVDAGS